MNCHPEVVMLLRSEALEMNCHPEVVMLLRSEALEMNCYPEGASATEGSPSRDLRPQTKREGEAPAEPDRDRNCIPARATLEMGG